MSILGTLGMIAGGIGTALGLGATATKIGTGIFGAVQGKKQYDTENEFRREQFEYNKNMNELQMQREDNQIQRMVTDAQKAGVSPLEPMGGQSGTIIGANQSTDPVGAQNAFLNALAQVANLDRVQAEIDNIKQDTEKKKAETANVNENTNFQVKQQEKINAEIENMQKTINLEQERLNFQKMDAKEKNAIQKKANEITEKGQKIQKDIAELQSNTQLTVTDKNNMTQSMLQQSQQEFQKALEMLQQENREKLIKKQEEMYKEIDRAAKDENIPEWQREIMKTQLNIQIANAVTGGIGSILGGGSGLLSGAGGLLGGVGNLLKAQGGK